MALPERSRPGLFDQSRQALVLPGLRTDLTPNGAKTANSLFPHPG